MRKHVDSVDPPWEGGGPGAGVDDEVSDFSSVPSMLLSVADEMAVKTGRHTESEKRSPPVRRGGLVGNGARNGLARFWTAATPLRLKKKKKPPSTWPQSPGLR